MTYEQAASLSGNTDKDLENAELLTSLVEEELQKHPFKRMPRSVRLLGAGYGCICFYCNGDTCYAVRNNGFDLDLIMENTHGVESAFKEITEIIHG